eukprot:UN12665
MIAYSTDPWTSVTDPTAVIIDPDNDDWIICGGFRGGRVMKILSVRVVFGPCLFGSCIQTLDSCVPSLDTDYDPENHMNKDDTCVLDIHTEVDILNVTYTYDSNEFITVA